LRTVFGEVSIPAASCGVFEWNKIRDNFEHENSCSGNKGVIRFGGELLID